MVDDADAAIRSGNDPSEIPGLIGATLVAVAPPAACLLLAFGSYQMLVWGALLWVAAVVLKTVVAGVVHWQLADRLTTRRMSALQGLISAVCELGLAAVWFFPRRPIAFDDAACFGIGAGSLEALAIVAYVVFQHLGGKKADEETLAQWRENAASSFWVRYHMAIERLGALFGHVGARGLVALGVGSSAVLPGVALVLLPLVSFSVVDGIASYGSAAGWRWLEPRIARPFYALVLLIGAIELALFVALGIGRS